jgi:hypothetical protein
VGTSTTETRHTFIINNNKTTWQANKFGTENVDGTNAIADRPGCTVNVAVGRDHGRLISIFDDETNVDAETCKGTYQSY